MRRFEVAVEDVLRELSETMYRATMTATRARKSGGSGIKPRKWANGRYGMASVTATTLRVAQSSCVPGLLRKKGRRLRTTNTMRDAESTDSTNQPVRNWSLLAWRR